MVAGSGPTPARMLCLPSARQAQVRRICLPVALITYGGISMAVLEGVEASSSSSPIRQAEAEVSSRAYEAIEGQVLRSGLRPGRV